jgi:hypothetical protein
LQSLIVGRDLKFDVSLLFDRAQKYLERIAQFPEALVRQLGEGENVRVRQLGKHQQG